MPLRGKILNTWEVDSQEILGSQEVHDISVALGVDPAIDDLDSLALSQGVYLGGCGLGRFAHCYSSLRPLRSALQTVGESRTCLCGNAAAV